MDRINVLGNDAPPRSSVSPMKTSLPVPIAWFRPALFLPTRQPDKDHTGEGA